MYAFQLEETAVDGLRRIAVECLDDAIGHLSGDDPARADERVHESRKRLKELRALLRVARGALPRKRRRAPDRRLRDAARQLSGARELLALCDEVARWPLEGEGWGLIGPGLERHLAHRTSARLAPADRPLSGEVSTHAAI